MKNYSNYLEINGGNVKGSITNNADLKINGGNFIAESNSTNGSLEGRITNKGNLEMTGGTITCTGKNTSITAIKNEGTANISNVTIDINIDEYVSSVKACGIHDIALKGISLDGVTINIIIGETDIRWPDKVYGIKNEHGNANISNTEINVQTNCKNSESASYGIVSGRETLNINENVTINSNAYKSYGISKEGTGDINILKSLTINSNGTDSKSCGIYGKKTGTIKIGENDEKLDNDSIQIISNQYGLYIENSEVKWYDGTIKGKKAIEGTIKEIETNCQIETTVETIDETNIEIATLVDNVKIAKIGETEYSSLEEAINSCNDDEQTTIQLIYPNVTLNQKINIPERKNIILDLNGNTINSDEKLENNGTLEIINSAEDGKFNAYIINNGNLKLNHIKIDKIALIDDFIINNGTLNIEDMQMEINIQGNNTYHIINNKGTLNYNGGTLSFNQYNYETSGKDYDGSGFIIYNNENCTVNMNGGTIETWIDVIYNNNGKVNINEGEIKCKKLGNSIGIYNKQGQVEIKGGKIEASLSAIYNMSGNVKVIDGTIKTNRMGILNLGTVEMSGGKIEHSSLDCADNVIGVYNRENCLFKMTGGEINLRRNDGIYNYGNVEIIKGTISVTNEYDDIDAIGISNIGNLTIGTKGGEVSKEEPTIIGSKSGVTNYYDSGNFKFYDGIIKGTKKTIGGTITEIEEDTELITNTDEKGKKQSYLDRIELAQIGEKIYYKLEDAINDVPENNENEVTIKLLRNVRYLNTETSKVIENRNIILDLNGYKIETDKEYIIINKGTLKIIDGSTENTGLIKYMGTGAKYAIKNEGNLEINNIEIPGIHNVNGATTLDTSHYVSLINNESTLTINNAIIMQRIENKENAVININNIEDRAGINNKGELNIYGAKNILEINNNETGVVNISGGRISKINNYNIVEQTAGTVGNYTSKNSKTTYNVIGGTVETLQNGGILNVGQKDGVVDITNPYINSVVNYVANGINLYDGTIGGGYLEIEDIEEGYGIAIEFFRYMNKMYLTQNPEAKIGEQEYTTLQDAINAVPEGNTEPVTITINRDTVHTKKQQIEVTENKNIILDLNGKTIVTSVDESIINKGTLNIINNSEAKIASIKIAGMNEAKNVIKNEGTLGLSNIDLKGYIYNTGILTVNEANISNQRK